MNNDIIVGSKHVGDNNNCYIIAEAGFNHNGDISIAKKMIKYAAKSGASAIKFQIVNADKFVPEKIKNTKDQNATLGDKDNLYNILKKCELSQDDYLNLFEYSKKKNIEFLASFTELETAAFLYDMGVSAFKVASGEITNTPFLKELAMYNIPILLSTGMSTLCEVDEAISSIYPFNKNILLMHCTSRYPTSYDDVNLYSMLTLKNAFQVPIGYSDHTTDALASIVAVSMGASVIEKHFTLDKDMSGPDHKMSMNPEELYNMINSIRSVEIMKGNPFKKPTDSELEMRILSRRSIVSTCDIPCDTIITTDMLTLLRPATGLAPKYLPMLIGKKLNRDINKGENISLYDVI